MSTVGVIAHFKIKHGKEVKIAQFFKEGLPTVQKQPITTRWFAFRISPTIYGAFAAFATEEDRSMLLSSGGPVLAKKYSDIFAQPPTFEKVDILESRIAG